MAVPSITLTDEQHAALMQAQQVLEQLRPQIEHLASCGVDCINIRKDYADAVKRIALLLTHFPPPPRQ